MFDFTRHVGCAMLTLCGPCVLPIDAHAVDLGNGWGPNALEISKLPDYCKKYFLEKKVPPNCDGVHHLCAGKVLINRVNDFSIPKAERRRILGQAKNEVGYIFGRNNTYCAVMPDARATRNEIPILEILVR